VPPVIPSTTGRLLRGRSLGSGPHPGDGVGIRRRRLPGEALLGVVGAASLLLACAHPPLSVETLVVTATAYNSLPGQTSGNPSIAAWGDRLEPGMRAIAVSRDLLELGLTHRTPVRIEGLPGEYVVLDKLAARWQRRIDIYMGTDREAALRWGKRKVRISWRTGHRDSMWPGPLHDDPPPLLIARGSDPPDDPPGEVAPATADAGPARRP